ncbi:I78 family peptidase inhibitor [Sphingobium sp. BYY-5]|uniref:I78 family peptidase inhibitor n=1 Tax=Sphingobium sp. BYY-5 TaxID=2926400 RepID=UPI001FA7DC7B|nr:I78 family peptidase inhibitor [Sphingobium sp. BYY-5]MCI4590483.1 I78 family peptidase inhibitor [Sphingobium sp. BYY-5]
MRTAAFAMMAAATALPLAACAGANGPGPDTPPPTAEGPCSNDGLDRFIGQKASAEVGAELLKASGAKTLRWGGPGTAMTMDFRPDRLTVSYDEQMAITAARCG